MTRVLLLLDQKENERLLADELGQRHEVLIAADDSALDQSFDLCILDGPALDRLWARVEQRKALEGPVLLPVLLATSRPDVKMITRHVWRTIDELIITPIEKSELWARTQILVRARDLSLALRQRAQAAEHATRTRDEVLAIVSHDLRNPLNLVLTSGSFLLETATGLHRKEREQLQMIHRATEQMNRLIQDLLEVASLEAGKVPVQIARETVEPLVREACALQAHMADARSIELTCVCDPDLPDVLADRDRIQQVFGNLISNALRFTPEGGSITVRATRADETIAFSVSDSGPGISPEDLPHVFDRFWQARRTKAGGAGLGLAIARGIVTAHGGEMWTKSELGRGSTFVFTIPVLGAAGLGTGRAAGGHSPA